MTNISKKLNKLQYCRHEVYQTPRKPNCHDVLEQSCISQSIPFQLMARITLNNTGCFMLCMWKPQIFSHKAGHECSIRTICTITMLPKWQHQFPPLKNGSSECSHKQSEPNQLNFQCSKLSMDGKLYHCHAEYASNHLNWAGKQKSVTKGL